MTEGIVKTAASAVRRFPGTFLVVAVAAFKLLIVKPIGEAGPDIPDPRLLASLSLGLPLTVAFHLFAERVFPKRRAAAALLGLSALIPLVLYYFLLPPVVEGAPGYLFHRHVVLLIGLHLLVSFAGFLGAHREGFWSFNKTLFLRFLAAALFSGTLYLGLLAVVGGLGSLFGAGEEFFHYFEWDLGVAVSLVFNTWFFLAGIPDMTLPYAPTDYPRGLRNFCQFVLCPLILLYALVVLLGVTKVLLLGEKLEGGFTFIAVLGMLAYLLIYPLDRASRWATFYSRAYFSLLLPFVALQVYILAKNPDKDGLGESSYYLWVLSAWLGLTALYFLFSKRRTIAWIPVSLSAIAFLSIAGPWGAYSLSKKSQLARLKALGGNALPLSVKTAAQTINALPAEQSADFHAQAKKMSEFYGVKALASIFREPLSEDATLEAILRGEPAAPAARESPEARTMSVSFSTHGNEDVIDVKGYDHYYREVMEVAPTQGPQDCIYLMCARLLEGENRILLFDRKGERGRVDVSPFLKSLIASHESEMKKQWESPDNGGQASVDLERKDFAYDFTMDVGGRPMKGRFLFWTVYAEKKGDAFRLKSFQTNVLLADQ